MFHFFTSTSSEFQNLSLALQLLENFLLSDTFKFCLFLFSIVGFLIFIAYQMGHFQSSVSVSMLLKFFLILTCCLGIKVDFSLKKFGAKGPELEQSFHLPVSVAFPLSVSNLITLKAQNFLFSTGEISDKGFLKSLDNLVFPDQDLNQSSSKLNKSFALSQANITNFKHFCLLPDLASALYSLEDLFEINLKEQGKSIIDFFEQNSSRLRYPPFLTIQNSKSQEKFEIEPRPHTKKFSNSSTKKDFQNKINDQEGYDQQDLNSCSSCAESAQKVLSIIFTKPQTDYQEIKNFRDQFFTENGQPGEKSLFLERLQSSLSLGIELLLACSIALFPLTLLVCLFESSLSLLCSHFFLTNGLIFSKVIFSLIELFAYNYLKFEQEALCSLKDLLAYESVAYSTYLMSLGLGFLVLFFIFVFSFKLSSSFFSLACRFQSTVGQAISENIYTHRETQANFSKDSFSSLNSRFENKVKSVSRSSMTSADASPSSSSALAPSSLTPSTTSSSVPEFSNFTEGSSSTLHTNLQGSSMRSTSSSAQVKEMTSQSSGSKVHEQAKASSSLKINGSEPNNHGAKVPQKSSQISVTKPLFKEHLDNSIMASKTALHSTPSKLDSHFLLNPMKSSKQSKVKTTSKNSRASSYSQIKKSRVLEELKQKSKNASKISNEN